MLHHRRCYAPRCSLRSGSFCAGSIREDMIQCWLGGKRDCMICRGKMLAKPRMVTRYLLVYCSLTQCVAFLCSRFQLRNICLTAAKFLGWSTMHVPTYKHFYWPTRSLRGLSNILKSRTMPPLECFVVFDNVVLTESCYDKIKTNFWQAKFYTQKKEEMQTEFIIKKLSEKCIRNIKV
jgi:hypothetical protein